MNPAVADLRVCWLGRMEFQRALALQEEIVLKKREDSSVGDQLLLLEHEPVYTIGRTPDQSSLSARPTAGQIRSGELGAAHLPHPLFRHQPRRPGHVSRARTANGLPHHRSAPMRSGFAQVLALARTIAH